MGSRSVGTQDFAYIGKLINEKSKLLTVTSWSQDISGHTRISGHLLILNKSCKTGHIWTVDAFVEKTVFEGMRGNNCTKYSCIMMIWRIHAEDT